MADSHGTIGPPDALGSLAGQDSAPGAGQDSAQDAAQDAAPDSAPGSGAFKQCCADLYSNEWALRLFGDSLHPGGLELTADLTHSLEIGPETRLLDVAAGGGQSAVYAAKEFGCEVVGIDYGADSVRRAARFATEAGLGDRVSFREGDAERLPFEAAEFDAVLCECALCTFPNKPRAAAEMARVLKPGGRLGLSDVTRSGELPAALSGLVGQVACMADALSADAYVSLLQGVGLRVESLQRHDEALGQLIDSVYRRLLVLEAAVKVRQFTPGGFDGFDVRAAREMAHEAADAVRSGRLGYVALIAAKSDRAAGGHP